MDRLQSPATRRTKTVQKTYDIEASPAVIDRIDRLFTIMQLAAAQGSSRDLGIWLDGDGPDKFQVLNELFIDCYRAGARKALEEGHAVLAQDDGYEGMRVELPDREVHKFFMDDGTVREWRDQVI